jgi:hypothetical protein
MTPLSELIHLVPQEKVDDFLREIGSGTNTVRVTKHAHSRPNPRMRGVMKKVLDEVFPSHYGISAITRLDELRLLAGLQPRYLAEFFHQCGGELVGVSPNLRTNNGIDYVAASLGDTDNRPAVAYYMALSESATAPAATDTSVAGEITTAGLARTTASYAHTTAATSYTLSKTFTATDPGFSAVQKEGILNAGSGGTLFVENTFTPTALVSGDQLTVTHTINI